MSRDPLANPEEAIRRLYGYVAYRIGPGPHAEDVVAEALERALRYRKSFDPRKGSPAAWLAGIATRVMADAARTSATRSEADPEDHQQPVEDFSSRSERKIDLGRAIARLDERDRELISLRYGADLKAREIGEILELRTNTVEVALSRALDRLRAILGGDAAVPDAALETTRQP